MKVFLGKRSVEISARKLSFFEKGIGLMFRTRESGNLLFEFSRDTRNAITSFFVFFDFLAVWLDEKNRVLEVQKIRPWKLSVSPKKKFRRLIEIPINKKNRKFVEFFVEGGKI